MRKREGMKKRRSRILAWLLACLMVLSVIQGTGWGSLTVQAEEAEKFIWGSGTDEVISMTTPVLVQTDLEEELNYLLTAIAYPLIYVAAVFVCTALTVLAVQQLSDASRHRYRYLSLIHI